MNDLVLGGIVSAIGGGYCFKIKGDRRTLFKIKKALSKQFKAEIKHGYHDKEAV